MGSGGYLGFMQITTVVQSCYLGSKASSDGSPKKVYRTFLGSENVKSAIQLAALHKHNVLVNN